MEYKYPKSLDDFDRLTIYQTIDPITKDWGPSKVTGKMCKDTQDFLNLHIKRKEIRIIQD
jgi:hypothetical protein